MYKYQNRRRKRAQLALIYGLMVIAVLSIVAVLFLIIQGYRFNRYDGKIEQGGLVQFNSRPTGASVSVDGMVLSAQTASRITLTSGTHDITMTRDGYTTWKKTVDVKAGSVLWLNYAQLIPTAPTISTAATLRGSVTPLTTPNYKELALVEVATEPNITLVTLDTDSPRTTRLEIPATAYTAPAEGESSEFSLMSWDKSGRYLLVKHVVGAKTEYLSVDTDDAARSRDLSTSLGVEIADVKYSYADSATAYILTSSHELRRADLNQTTISGPLATNVAEFAMTDQTTMTFSTLPDEAGARTVGYVSAGQTVAKQIQKFDDIGTTPLHIATGTYYGDRYVAIAHGNTADIYTGSLPSSDSTAALSLKKYANFSIDGGAEHLGFSPDQYRFVYASNGATVMTYDLELKKSARVTLQAPLDGDVVWMDGYHIISTAGGNGYYYDFDGTNGQLFASGTLAQPATLASGEKYIYYFVQADGGVKLQRLRTVTN